MLFFPTVFSVFLNDALGMREALINLQSGLYALSVAKVTDDGIM